MQCPRCGANVPEELPVCGSCGYDLTNPAVSVGQPSQSTPFDREMDTERAAEVSGQLDLRPGLAVRPGGAALSTPAGLLYKPGDLIAERYEVDQVLGEGPVGVVYSALDRDTDVQVAIKVVLPEYFPNRASLRRFQEWLEPALDLQHVNIVRVYEVTPLGNRFAIVQQMIVGRSLSEVLAGRLPQGIASPRDEVRTILTQIGEALTYAHPDRVHGGLKPENVLILPAGLVVTDFGLAFALDAKAYLAGHRHRRMPTRYLAPELQAGETIDARADIYSLGVLAFELLLGIPLPSSPQHVDSSMDTLPAPARKVLQAALSARPSDRPKDVDDLVEGLVSTVSDRTPTSPPARPGGNTNVLDVGDLEVVDEDGDEDGGFPEESTPRDVIPASIIKASDAAPALGEGEDTNPRAKVPSGRTASPKRSDQAAAAPAPARAVRQGSAPRLGFTLEPGSAAAIPPARSAKNVEAGPLLGGRRADPEAGIEAAPEIFDLPDIDADGKRPNRPFGLALSGSPPRARKAMEAAEAMDFDKSLELALASAAAVPPPAPGVKKRRKRNDAPPDPDAMRNRPVAAGGEIQSPHSNPRMHLPQSSEPAVAVVDLGSTTSTQPPVRREGTAQIPLPEGFAKRGLSWWVYLLLFGVACGVVVGGLVLYKRHMDGEAERAAQRRRARLVELQERTAITPDAGGHGGAVATRITPMPRPTPAPRPLVWAGSCPTDMVQVKRRGADFCVDRFEYPNRQGTLPQFAVDEQEATRLCIAASKRLCTRVQWEEACGGPRGTLFAYGKRFKQGVCATADEAGRKQPPQPSGGLEACRSHWGAFDMNGNMAEWVVGGQLLGGSAAKPGTQTSCESDAGSGGTAYNGFRCCIDARP